MQSKEDFENDYVDRAKVEQSETYWINLLKPLFTGKKIVLTGDNVAGLLRTARLLRELGSELPFILGTGGKDAGTLPTPEEAQWLTLELPPKTGFVEAVHVSQERLRGLPENALAALDAYDPDHTALVLGTFLHEQAEVAGRVSFTYRRPEWLALDDKVAIDALWDKAGITREPYEIVTVNKDSLLAAAKRIDKGAGTVWSGDARDGWHGGAEGTRWIQNKADEDEALAYFSTRCDKVRVMPFLEGIPCSIHGVVFSDYSVVLRPVEMVVLRRSVPDHLFYAGTATFWDPRPDDREYMRDIAKQVGDTLRETVNYRGAFTLDGVMTKDGFRPTELNPRSGAGMRSLMQGLPELPIQLIADALTAGYELDYRPEQLEKLILQTGDRTRGGGTWRAIPDKITAVDNKPLALKDGHWHWAAEGEPADGNIVVAVSPSGSFIRLGLDSERTPKGPSVAPLACAFWQFVDQEMKGQIGPLEAAKPVR